MDKNFQTIVIELGATASAATYQLAEIRNKVLRVDRFSPPRLNHLMDNKTVLKLSRA
jgi:hypothetical protein